MRQRSVKDSAYRDAGTPVTWKTKEDLDEKYAGGTCKKNKLLTEQALNS